MNKKLIYFVSHPIQYQAPLLRMISLDPDITLKVVFESDFSTRSYFDSGFKKRIEWDVPLREGYDSSLRSEVIIHEEIENSDVIWVHGWQSSLLRKVIKIAAKLQKPVLMRSENWTGAMPDGNWVRRILKRTYLRRIFRDCSGFLVIGSKNREYYLDHGVPAEKLFDMPYAVDNKFFLDRSKSVKMEDFKARLGLDTNRKVILFAGKMMPRKNPQLLIAIWKKLAAQMPKPPLLVFVGDGEMRVNLEKSSPEGIIYVGFQNQSSMPLYYASADVFVLFSEKEPWGMAINEAMASGTSVLASNQCGAAYDLIDQYTGRMVDINDERVLLNAFEEVLENSNQMGKAAQQKVLNWDFDADLIGLKKALKMVL
ncbi:MAG: glycosyltransferase family 4 protein [Pseudomonadota bacterium]|nr:glycosyltransferase family 4 protein [Pseudomonadota bacterium]